MVGTVLAQYQISEKLGGGGMGVVYRALDTKLNRPVAIKFLSDDLADMPARRRFQREAQLASSLNHPHILTVYDAGVFEGREYLVTEFVDGGTLKDWARAQKHTWPQIVEILVGVADGLAAAHAAGILHRDIKPANILVAKNGYAKLADFGLAKLQDRTPASDVTQTLTEDHTQPGVIRGTVAYMSPEQAVGGAADARSDIFSFGAVLYEMLAGRKPFVGKTQLDVMQAIAHGTPKPLGAEVPQPLRMLVEKALKKHPAERYQSARELVVDLKRAERLKAADAHVNTSRAKPRWRPLGIAACAAVIIMGVALGIFWRLWHTDYFWHNPLSDARVDRLTDWEGDEIAAGISPDGRFTVFLSDRDGQFDAWVSQIGSGAFVNLTKGRFPFLFLGLFHQVGFSGDGSQVWIVSNPTPRTALTLLAPSVGGDPHPFLAGGMNPAWSPDGTRIVYHKGSSGDPIFLADRTGSNPKQIFTEKPGGHCHFLTWSPDGRFIYFVKGAMTTDEMDIWRIPPSEGAVPERLTYHNARVAFPAWLDSRHLIYSATADDGSGQWLYSMDVEHRIPHRVSYGIAEQYLSVAVSKTRPSRLVAAVATPSASLWTVPVSDHIQTEEAVSHFPIPNARALGPRFAPGYFLFLSSRGGGEGMWKLEKGAARELWNGSEGGVVAPPAISPDGSQICFSYRKQGRSGLYLMSADGTNIRSLTEFSDVRGAASWSLDGKWIAVAANQGEASRIFKVPVDGGSPVRLVDRLSHRPLWSPDGKFIVYSEPLEGGSLQVKAVTPDKAQSPLPDIRVNNLGSPYRFIPNSKEIIFLKEGSVRGQNFYRVNLQSGQQRQLTDLKPGFFIQSFDISPDGKQIVFDRLRENSDIVVMDLKR